ncbi:MAG: transcriptional regulator [Betaproteobacteria bacterium RBG_16_58_11]|nr:MAG: transcriptional regulator [Betaproteobacteria bacterium RBG_16_58_11]
MKKIDTLKDDNRITESSGNVFLDLGFPPEEAALLAMRADLMAKLRLTIDEKKWTQAEAAKVLGIAQSRVSDLVRGKWEKFSLDMLISLASRAGLQPRLELAA